MVDLPGGLMYFQLINFRTKCVMSRSWRTRLASPVIWFVCKTKNGIYQNVYVEYNNNHIWWITEMLASQWKINFDFR